MSETRFTPGPWSWRTSNSWRRLGSDFTGKDSDVLYPSIDRHDGQPNLEFPNGGFEGPDAHLIAAAPELYAALDGLLKGISECHYCGAALIPPRGAAHCEDCPSGCESHDPPDCVQLSQLVAEADAALAKARGEEPKL